MAFREPQDRNGGRATPLNVLGGPLAACGQDPVTGFWRDGCCNTGPEDVGAHTVCAIMTEEFLRFSHTSGNDLTTPRPEFNFPGLQPGDSWCLCAPRWVEAYLAGAAPKLRLAATHIATLGYAPIEVLKAHALDLN